MGKVHGSLARAGKVKSQTPKVEKQEKKKTPKGRAKKRILYNRRCVSPLSQYQSGLIAHSSIALSMSHPLQEASVECKCLLSASQCVPLRDEQSSIQVPEITRVDTTVVFPDSSHSLSSC
ncbi:hypothetical protein FRC19_002790 [Serendipita sp. 401]|nr:hypothetical protein FRC19_002790 [Serendipita sp. 401]